MDDIYIVVTTVSSDEDAKKLARKLLQKRLVACTQITSGVTSLYWWQGSIVEDNEWLLSMKTLQCKYDVLVEEILRIHPYDTPEIIALQVSDVSSDYKKWMFRELEEDRL